MCSGCGRSDTPRRPVKERPTSRGSSSELNRRQQVTELLFLRLQVASCRLRRRNLDGHALAHDETVARDAIELAWIVAEEPERTDAEIAKDLDAGTIVAMIGAEAQTLVGFDRVAAFVLQGIRADLVGESDAAAFLIQIEQDAAALRGNELHRRLELRTTVASRGAEHIAGQARGMDTREHVLAAADLTADERDMRRPVVRALIDVNGEIAVLRRQFRRGDAAHHRPRAKCAEESTDTSRE